MEAAGDLPLVATPVEMPQLGNTVEECIVTRWVKQAGDSVSAGDVVAEIETDKTTFEVTAPVEGTVLATFFEEGALVPVFTNIFVIGNPGENVSAFKPDARAAPQAPTPPSPAIIDPAPVAAASIASHATFSPRARKFAATRGFQPSAVAGTGPGGRILERDVRRAYESSVPTSNLRALIARRMRESLASTAQYTLNSSADATALLALRASIKAGAGPDKADITINDLVTFCTIRALVETPDVNAEFVDGRIVKHAEVHLAFAVDTVKGLVAPVVRHAQKLSIVELSQRLKELANKAVQGALAADELSGATFTISNLGTLGIESFTPVINPPQVAILGVGAIQLRPVRKGGAVEFVDSIGLSLTCDHQVIDGAPGARFLQVLRDKIGHVNLGALEP